MADARINLPGENWKPIPGWEGRYEVSSLGRIKSIARTVITAGGVSKNIKERVLKTRVSGAGYRAITLRGGGKSEHLRINRTVCRAFHGEPQGQLHAAHNNGNPADDRAENLRWATVKSNAADRIAHGTTTRGRLLGDGGHCKLTEAQVREIRQLHNPMRGSGAGTISLGKCFGVSGRTIRRIIHRTTWDHIE